MPSVTVAVSPLDSSKQYNDIGPSKWNELVYEAMLVLINQGKYDDLIDYCNTQILEPRNDSGQDLAISKTKNQEQLSKDNIKMLGANLKAAGPINELFEHFKNAQNNQDFYKAILKNDNLESLISDLKQPLLFNLLENSEEKDADEKIIDKLLDPSSYPYIDQKIRDNQKEASKQLTTIAKKATKIDHCIQILDAIKRNDFTLETLGKTEGENIAKAMLKTKREGFLESLKFKRFDITKIPDLNIQNKIVFAKCIDNSTQLANLAGNLSEECKQNDTDHIRAVQAIINNENFNYEVADQLFKNSSNIKYLEEKDLIKLANFAGSHDQFSSILGAEKTSPRVVDAVIQAANRKPQDAFSKFFDDLEKRISTALANKPRRRVVRGFLTITKGFFLPLAKKVFALPSAVAANFIRHPIKTVKQIRSGRFQWPFAGTPTSMLKKISSDIGDLDQNGKVKFMALNHDSKKDLVSCGGNDSFKRQFGQINEARDYMPEAAPQADSGLSSQASSASSELGNKLSQLAKVTSSTAASLDSKLTDKTSLSTLETWVIQKSSDNPHLINWLDNKVSFPKQTDANNQNQQAEVIYETLEKIVELTKKQNPSPTGEVSLEAADFDREMMLKILTKLEEKTIPGLKLSFGDNNKLLSTDEQIRLHKINQTAQLNPNRISTPSKIDEDDVNSRLGIDQSSSVSIATKPGRGT